MKVAAKLQLGNTWELAAVPYVPVEKLVAQHMVNLREEGVDGLMLGWTLGGYPSPNLEIAHHPKRGRGGAAGGRGAAAWLPGASGASCARGRAWQQFSAVRRVPFDIGVVYTAPQQYGPANLLCAADRLPGDDGGLPVR